MTIPEDISPNTKDVKNKSERLLRVSLPVLTKSPIQPIENRFLIIETEGTFSDDDSLACQLTCCWAHLLNLIVDERQLRVSAGDVGMKHSVDLFVQRKRFGQQIETKFLLTLE